MSWYFLTFAGLRNIYSLILGADNCELDNIMTSDHSNSAVYYIAANQTKQLAMQMSMQQGAMVNSRAKQQSSQMFKVRARSLCCLCDIVLR